MKINKSAFTLIELLVVIAIIGLLATLSIIALSNARLKSRDSKRLADIKQLQTAMDLYYDANDKYPTLGEFQSGSLTYVSPTSGTTTYISIPTPPSPSDGSCTDSNNSYIYSPTIDRSSYALSFCLGSQNNSLVSGMKRANPAGICSVDCTGKVCGDDHCGGTCGTCGIGQACSNGQCNCVPNCAGKVCGDNGCGGLCGTCTSTSTPVCLAGGTCGCTQDSECSGNNICQNNACVSLISYAGDTYGVVKIGTQYWLDKNLNVGTMITSTTTPSVNYSSNDSLIEKFCYNNHATNPAPGTPVCSNGGNCGGCDTDGGLYTWYEAMQLPASCHLGSQVNCATDPTNTCCVTANHDICPTGWHVPSDNDYKTLEVSLGMCTGAGTGCVDAGGSRGTDQGTNLKTGGISGFNGLLVGYRSNAGSFTNQGTDARLWSSSVNSTTGTSDWLRFLLSSSAGVYRGALARTYGASVRCLKD